jgi:hypothetical protein
MGAGGATLRHAKMDDVLLRMHQLGKGLDGYDKAVIDHQIDGDLLESIAVYSIIFA